MIEFAKEVGMALLWFMLGCLIGERSQINKDNKK